jgi:CheY-like chemotaxis protein
MSEPSTAWQNTETSLAERLAEVGDSKRGPLMIGFHGEKAHLLTRRGKDKSMEDRILVVDDEKEIREMLLKALTRLTEFRAELAGDDEEALKKIEQKNFDLVLTDLKMPKKDGLQLVSEIAKSKPEIFAVLMTGHGTIDSALEAMKQGASLLSRKRLYTTVIPDLRSLPRTRNGGIQSF